MYLASKGQQKFAVKRVDKHFPPEKERRNYAQKMLTREVNLMKVMRGKPHFVQLHKAFQDEQSCYFVMEAGLKVNLADLLRLHGKGLPISLCRYILGSLV